jgi:hypothetical protein
LGALLEHCKIDPAFGSAFGSEFQA